MEDKRAEVQGAKKIDDAVTAGQVSMEKATQAGRETVVKAAKAGKENAEKATKAGVDILSNGYDRYLALTREQLERVLPQAVGKFGDLANISKGAADAFLKAGDVTAKALESIGDDIVTYNRKVWEDSIANTKTLLGCKTFEDVAELQATVARAQFEKFLGDSAKLGELSVKTVDRALEPVGASVNQAIDRFGKPIAA